MTEFEVLDITGSPIPKLGSEMNQDRVSLAGRLPELLPPSSANLGPLGPLGWLQGSHLSSLVRRFDASGASADAHINPSLGFGAGNRIPHDDLVLAFGEQCNFVTAFPREAE
jgi:hypothetical protein